MGLLQASVNQRTALSTSLVCFFTLDSRHLSVSCCSNSNSCQETNQTVWEANKEQEEEEDATCLHPSDNRQATFLGPAQLDKPTTTIEKVSIILNRYSNRNRNCFHLSVCQFGLDWIHWKRVEFVCSENYSSSDQHSSLLCCYWAAMEEWPCFG